MNILIVEDDALLAWVLQDILTEAGHVTYGPADSIEGALRLATQKRPELALVNIKLHGVDDGLIVVRELFERYNVSSIVVSGQPDQAREVKDIALGFICKPYEKETVLASINIVAALHDGTHPGATPSGLELYTRGQPVHQR